VQSIPEEYPEKLRKVIASCLQTDPKLRPAARDVVLEIAEACIDLSGDASLARIKQRLSEAEPRIATPVGYSRWRRTARYLDAEIVKSINLQLLKACWNWKTDEAVALIDGWSASITCETEKGMTVLHVATSCHKDSNLPVKDCPELIAALVQRGARLNAQDNQKMTALHYAAEQTRTQSIKMLLENGADPRLADKQGRLAIHLAATWANTEACQLLIDAAPDTVSARDENGYTPLHSAASNENTDTVRLLLLKGADAKAQDNRGRMPRECLPPIYQPDWGIPKPIVDPPPLCRGVLRRAEIRRRRRRSEVDVAVF
jgi:ankyrin repeat protein